MKYIQKKTERMLHIEKTYNDSIEEILRRLYIDEHRSLDDMTQLLYTDRRLIMKWLKMAGVYSRKLNIG